MEVLACFDQMGERFWAGQLKEVLLPSSLLWVEMEGWVQVPLVPTFQNWVDES